MEHRFRPVKLQAAFIRQLVEQGEDPADHAATVLAVRTKDGKSQPPRCPPPVVLDALDSCVSSRVHPFHTYTAPAQSTHFSAHSQTCANARGAEIQSYFGASTPDGIAFQFRAIKHGANVLKDAVDKGNDPVAAFAATLGSGSSSGLPSTPSHRTPSSAKRARSTKVAASGGSTPASKRRRATTIKIEDDSDEDSPEVDYDELDKTPTKHVKKVKSTPRKNPELLPRSAWANPSPSSAGGKTPTGAARRPSATPTPAPSFGVPPAPGVTTQSSSAASASVTASGNTPAAGSYSAGAQYSSSVATPFGMPAMSYPDSSSYHQSSTSMTTTAQGQGQSQSQTNGQHRSRCPPSPTPTASTVTAMNVSMTMPDAPAPAASSSSLMAGPSASSPAAGAAPTFIKTEDDLPFATPSSSYPSAGGYCLSDDAEQAMYAGAGVGAGGGGFDNDDADDDDGQEEQWDAGDC